jgi:hypothetical protein
LSSLLESELTHLVIFLFFLFFVFLRDFVSFLKLFIRIKSGVVIVIVI